MVSVIEYFHPDELKERVNLWDRKFNIGIPPLPFSSSSSSFASHSLNSSNIDRFIFETPFTKGGKAYSQDMREQYKKKTILYTERPFPFLLSRIPVKKKEEVCFGPFRIGCLA